MLHARHGRPVQPPTTMAAQVLDFFERTRFKGEEAFGDGADNLTGIVAVFPKPAQAAASSEMGA